MGKRVKVVAAILALSLAGLVSWELLHLPEAEPAYEGKKLKAWLATGVTGPQRDLEDWTRFSDWMRNQMPSLIRALDTKDNPLRRPYLWIKTKAPSLMANRMPHWTDPAQVRLSAIYWLGEQGLLSMEAMPALCELTTRDPNGEVRRQAIWALARIDSESEHARKAMVAALTTDADRRVRAAAAGGLEVGQLSSSEEVIIAFTHGLSDRDPLVRQICAAALGKCGPRAKAAMGSLQELAKRDDAAADYARSAIRQIEAATPILNK